MPIFHLSNKKINVTLAHYGPSSTETPITPITETTTAQCH